MQIVVVIYLFDQSLISAIVGLVEPFSLLSYEYWLFLEQNNIFLMFNVDMIFQTSEMSIIEVHSTSTSGFISLNTGIHFVVPNQYGQKLSETRKFC